MNNAADDLPTSVSSTKRVSQLLLVIIIAAVLVRAAVALFLGDEANPVSGAWDQVSYDTLAQRLVEGHGLTFPTAWYPFTRPNEPTAHWSYLYTLYLAAIYYVVGHQPLMARLVQVVLSGIVCWLVYRIGRRLFGEWAGLAAAALAACYAYLIFFAAALMTQTFYIMAVLAAIDQALSLAEKPAIRHWLILGIALGAGALLRQTLLLFVLVLLLWLVWRLGWRPAWRGLLIVVVVLGLFVLPWTAYNYHTFHDLLILNSNGGYWFYASNHPSQGTDFSGDITPDIPDNLRGLSEPAIDRGLYRAALGFIAGDPKRFILLSLSRVDDQFWLGLSPQSSLASNLGRVLSFTIYLPFMLAGLWLSRRHWRLCLPLYLYVAFDTTLCLISWAGPRYRLPSDAIMMEFAGLAVVTLAERIGLLRSVASPAAAAREQA